MILRYLSCCVLTLAVLASPSDEQSDFEQYKSSVDSGFSRFSGEVELALNEFIQQHDSLYSEYLKKIYLVWGDSVLPPQSVYLEFTDNYNSRVEMDFQNGEVEASVVIDDDSDQKEIVQAEEKLKEKLKESLITPGRKEAFTSDGPMERQETRPMLKDQVSDFDGKPVTVDNADGFAERIIQRDGIKRTTFVGGDGRRRIRLSAKYGLVPKHLMVRAKVFLPLVIGFSDEYTIDPRLVMAIIHTESYFNPRAVSHVPAFGLMQIVPATGGMEASRKVFGSARLLSPEYLYNARNNIRMGCAYLHVIRYEYLAEVTSDQIAYPPMIASYNGGIGSVCRALTGGERISRIPLALNSIGFDEVVSVLKRRLHATETKDYLVNVLKRMEFYDSVADM